MFELYQVGMAFIALLIGIIAWAKVSWTKKEKSQNLQLPKPDFTEYIDSGTSGSYVATTFAGRPLDRVSAHGLGFAGNSSLIVSGEGVHVSRYGERSFIIRKSSLVDLVRSSVVIDKAVEKDGLLSIVWKLGDTELESHFRFANSRARDEISLKISELLVGAK
jgi:hypothetical protein